MDGEFFRTDLRPGYTLYPLDFVGIMNEEAVRPGKLRNLSSSGCAVLVVLGSYVNDTGWTFPGVERIAAMAGLTCKTVRKAIRELSRSQIIEIHNRIASTGRSAKRYRWLLQPSGDTLFRIPHALVDGGVWRKLPRASKKLYLAFRFFGKSNTKLDPDFDESEHPYGGWLGGDPDLRKEYLSGRRFDYCVAPRLMIGKLAGITDRHFKKALQGLMNAKLISIVSTGCYEVKIEPSQLFDVGTLNLEIRNKGGVW